jgi:hypothetical protein
VTAQSGGNAGCCGLSLSLLSSSAQAGSPFKCAEGMA